MAELEWRVRVLVDRAVDDETLTKMTMMTRCQWAHVDHETRTTEAVGYVNAPSYHAALGHFVDRVMAATSAIPIEVEAKVVVDLRKERLAARRSAGGDS